MKKVVNWFLCIILLVIATTACSLPTSRDLKGASARDETKDTNKYNAYIELSNQINGGMYGSIFNNYVDRFGWEEEIYIDDEFNGYSTTPFIPTVIEHAGKTLNFASVEPSYGATDEKVKELMPIIIDMMNANNDIESYYTAKTYVDDDFEKGRELHKRYIALFEKYIEVGQQFLDEFSEITRERKYSDAEKLKDEDMLIRYYALLTVLRAQEIQEAFYNKGVGDDNILDFDVKEYEELYNMLTEDIEHYFEYAKDADRRKTEAWPSLEIFKTSIEGVKVTATDILRVLREQDPEINSDTKGKVTTGGRNAILSAFDRKVSFLVDAYNTSLNMTVVN
ncbi:YiiG family protein [Paenibacillus motobuensis]|uniref:YiiG family protein n=1 Tax=Paenibacillus TaxID=44249 RepID=UPI00203D40CF|nr:MULTISPECIES: YiiG family protein [Paenibacillus]MCM3042622.1 YiiG family protein [Paenibacillus lutimineralis]MCM3649726.1 YiiG family protein [Paenibacillus motobuensis]